MPVYKSLLIASAKGGVGKSTTALGLAAAFARNHKKVLLVDLDSTSRSLDMLTGSENSAIFDFGDVIEGKEIADVAINPIESLPEIGFISACTTSRLSYLASKNGDSIENTVRRGVERITASEYDTVICDTGGGLGYARASAELFDLGIITSEQGRTSVRAAEYAASQLEECGMSDMRLVVCSFDLKAVKKERRAGIIEMIDLSSLMCAGVVPYDADLQRMQDGGVVPDEKSITSRAYSNIARRIIGYDVRLFHGMKWYEKRRFAAF